MSLVWKLPTDRFADFLDGLDSSAYRLRGRPGIEHDFLERWQHLTLVPSQFARFRERTVSIDVG